MSRGPSSRRRLVAGCAWLLVGALAPTASASERTLDRIAAVINDNVITLSDVYDVGSEFIEARCEQPDAGKDCRSSAEAEVLDALVLRELERQELVKLGRDISEREVEAAIDQTVAQYGFPDRDALRDEVERSGADWAVYREQQVLEPLRRQTFAQLVLRPRISITEDELRDQYQRLVRSLEPSSRVTLSVIGHVVPDGGAEATVAAVQAVREGIVAVRDGTRSWEEVALELDDAGMGSVFSRPVDVAQLREELRTAVERTDVGSLSEPVLVNRIVYAVRVDARDRVEPDAAPFEEVRPQLENEVFSRKIAGAEEEWYALTKRRASILWMLGEPPPDLRGATRRRLSGNEPDAPADGADAIPADDAEPPQDAPPPEP